MRKFLTAFVLTLAFGAHAPVHAQATDVRVGPAADEEKASSAPAPAPKKEEKANGKAAEQTPKPQTPASVTAAAVPPAAPNATNSTSDAPAKSNPAAGLPSVSAPKGTDPAPPNNTGGGAPAVNNNPSTQPNANPSTAAPPAPPLTNVYRIGVGDVLDIRLLNHPDARVSTLFTVLSGGVIEYPLVREPVSVAGMTAEEFSAQLVAELRHRGVFERPQVRVSVREYASHAVIVSGLVSDPGTKILRREAVPLYVVVAEAQPKPEAGRAVVTAHASGKTTEVDLLDAAAMNLLVQPGDVVNLVARPPEFFYVGGEISSPGQKSFHAGMTLTQAVLASGGVTRLAGPQIKVSRQGPDGRLVSTEYNLNEIEGGAVPDPALRAGDRIEVQPVSARKK